MKQIKQVTTPLLILGIPRSGTTILASILGAHPDINMMFECIDKSAFSGLGKKYSGNKLCIYNQIKLHRRGSLLGKIVNRICNIGQRPRNWKQIKHTLFKSKYTRKIFPDSVYSINDYIKRNARIILIVRKDKDVISSLVRHGGMSQKQAQKFYQRAIKEKLKIFNYLFAEYTTSNFVVVGYARLLEEPFRTLHNLLEWLNLNHDDALIMEMIEKGSKYNIIYPHNKKILECARMKYRREE